MLNSKIPGNKYNETIFMGSLTLICFSLSFFRFLYTDTRIFLFLNWNLFLAVIPWAMSSYVRLRPNIQKNRSLLSILLFIWLLFYPNAPYILTDLFHLQSVSSMPIWYDLVLILSFAWTGLLFGFLSLWDIEKILEKFLKSRWLKIVMIFLLFMGSFGIYIGRYLRWNSWDLVIEPYGLISDIGERLINPFQYQQTWGMTLFMGIFLNMIYWSFRFLREKSSRLS